MKLETLKEAERLSELKNTLLVLTSRIVLPLYFMFWICDLVYAPEYKWEFLVLRSTIVPLAIIVYILTSSAQTSRQAEVSGLVYTLGLSLPITAMIMFLHDTGTAYYAGLNLVAIATLGFIPWSFTFFLIAIAAVYAPYILYTIWISSTPQDLINITVSGFFIVGTVIITMVIRMFRENLQDRELNTRLTLENEIEKRARAERELIQARDDALSANKMKSSFLANMSHELRTPLTAINGFASTLLETGQSKEERLATIRTIIRNGEHLLQLLNEVLDLSKIEANKMEIEQIKVSTFQLLDDIHHLEYILAHNKKLAFNINIKTELPKTIISDPIRLKQMIINLCSNAIKFTDHGSVELNISCNRQKELLEIEVRDTGIGIRQDKLKHIFSPFTQADSSMTRRYGGSGLGLAVTSRFATLLGGDIQVRSTPDVGSVFTLTVATGPLEQVEFARHDDNVESRRPVKLVQLRDQSLRGKVLVAEDTPDLQALIKFYISRTGASVTCVENGALAVEAAQKQHFDMIFMDMQMPVMDGLTAVRLLRKNNYNGPVIALTASAMAQDRDSCMRAGCDYFISKPINKIELIETLTRHLTQRESEQPSQDIITRTNAKVETV